jgi:putative oxygen-independent coproporphyrinogen III oxidase
MAGIYIHIPYCRQKCHYCNFFSVASRATMPAMIDAICHEAGLQHQYAPGQAIETVYFGGGTPSMLEPQLLSQLMDSLNRNYIFSAEPEITLEANPDDITPESLRLWKTIGINRLSIGVQSFRDEDLRYLNRVHDAGKALKCLQQAQEEGFSNLTLDLIFGIPTLDDAGWLSNIKTATDLKIPHISAYALTVEPRTALDLMIRKGKAKPVDEQQSARQFELMMQVMKEEGYLHYEISNYCLPGQFARHNTAYWKGETYLGLGPSAHSYNGQSRQWNVSSIKEYLEAIDRNSIPAESEKLSVEQTYNEYVMTGLRTMWGCNNLDIRLKFGARFSEYFSANTVPWIKNGNMDKSGDIYTLTKKGKLLADGIASDLFFVDNHNESKKSKV